jgi:hypothetical protein
MPKGKIFEVGDEVPEGFFDTPTKIAAPKKKIVRKKRIVK